MSFTIASAKEASVTAAPLFLFDFTWANGATLAVSSIAVTWGGTDYLPRVIAQQIDPIQALSPHGIEIPGTVKLTLADADKDLWALEAGNTFRGARLRVTFLFYDFETGDFSTDFLVPFVGRCAKPEVADDALVVTAGWILDLEAKSEPSAPIQPRCWQLFPSTAAQKLLAAVEGSLYYGCGVTDPTKTSCTFDKAGCAANANSPRFTGLTWEVPPASRSREYASGNWLTDLQSDPNDAKFGDKVPLVAGLAWVDTVSLGTWPEANSTRSENIVCEGRPEAILRVVANDEDLPAANSLDGSTYIVKDPLFRYNVVSTGDRDGALNLDHPWDGNGDYHGSQCVVEAVVYHKLTAGQLKVRALVRGPRVRGYVKIASVIGGVVTFADNAVNEDVAGNPPYSIRIFGNSNAALNNTFTLTSWAAGPPGSVTLSGSTASGTGGYIEYWTSSDRYAWFILHLLRRAGMALEDIGLSEFVAANRIHRKSVSFTARDGTTQAHPMYTLSAVLRTPRPLSDVISGLLRGCNSHLGRNLQTGQVALYARGAIAEQQAAAVPGSNDNTPVAGGFLAYRFGESSMVNDRARLNRPGRAAGAIANSVVIGFANEENDNSGDSVTVQDNDDINLMGQAIQGSFQADGCTALDRANRVGSIWLAEQINGDLWRWITTAKCIYVRVGHIVAVDNVKHGFSTALMRVTQIAPEADWAQCAITAALHDDAWYADAFDGVTGTPATGRRRDSLARPSWPWRPYAVQPASGDPLFGPTDWTFGLTLAYQSLRDGGPQPVATITGVKPVNNPSNLQKPVLGRQGTTASSGGTLAGSGRVYFIAVAHRDANGQPGPLSEPCVVVIAQAGTANTATAPVTYWDPAGSGYFVFIGLTPASLNATNDVGYSGTPGSVTVTDLPGSTWGPPDTECDVLVARPKYVWHAGVFGAAVTGIATRAITIAGAGWTTNEWAGYDCLIVAKYDLSALGLLVYRVASNSASVLTIASTSPDPNAAGVAVGDVIVMLSKPTVAGRVITDAKWANSLSNSGLGLTAHQEQGRVLRVCAGAGRGYRYPLADNTSTSVTLDVDPVVPMDSTSRYVIEDAAMLPERVESDAIANSDQTAGIEIALPLQNYTGETVLIEVATRDGGGNESASYLNPVRLAYVLGAQGTRDVNASSTMTPIDGLTLHNTAAGSQAFQLLPSSRVRNQTLLVRKSSADANTVTINTDAGDVFPDGSTSMVLTDAGDGGAVLLKFPGSGNVVIPFSAGGAGAGGGGIATEVTLTADATVGSPGTPTSGAFWTARVAQDATGGWTVTWGTGTDILLAPTINALVNSAPNTMCIVTFYGRSGKWYCIAQQLGVRTQ